MGPVGKRRVQGRRRPESPCEREARWIYCAGKKVSSHGKVQIIKMG